MANVLEAVSRKEKKNNQEIEFFLIEAKNNAVKRVFG